MRQLTLEEVHNVFAQKNLKSKDDSGVVVLIEKERKTKNGVIFNSELSLNTYVVQL